MNEERKQSRTWMTVTKAAVIAQMFAVVSMRSHLTIIVLLLPLYFVFFLSVYWLYIDDVPPLTVQYQNPLFTIVAVDSRDEALRFGVKANRGGDRVYIYREFCVTEDLDGYLRARWATLGFDFTVSESAFFGSPVGCHKTSFPVAVPLSAPTRDVLYRATIRFRVNPLQTVDVHLPPVPLTILSGDENK